jgi:hypothetical protein
MTILPRRISPRKVAEALRVTDRTISLEAPRTGAGFALQEKGLVRAMGRLE